MQTNPGNRPGSQLIDTPTCMIHAVREGNPNGPTVLFLHGNYFGLPIWDDWVNAYQDQFDLIRLDLPGFGLSHAPRSNSYDDAGDLSAITAVLESYNVNSCHVIGTVLGGKLAYRLAADQATRIQSLTLINSAGLPHHAQNPLTPTPLPEAVTGPILASPETFLEQLLKGHQGSKGRIPFPLARELITLSGKPRAIKEILKRMQQYIVGPAQDSLSQILCPTLLIHGGDNIQYSPADLQKFQQQLSQSQKVETHILEGFGQFLAFETCVNAINFTKNFINP